VAKVQVLPDALVNQIAAGEVVERPASVVKELVENALDAGAARITVEVDGGGIERLVVTDDGCGMVPEDARLALQRHATSKIRTAQDLTAIGTLGFRGEALPSIASVARLSLATSPDRSGLGTEVVADRGALPVVAPARHPQGTTVTVEDLFGNVPARRKFLKSPEAELRAVSKACIALALSRPDVHFTLVSRGRNVLDLPPAPSAASRFTELLGASELGEVLPVLGEALGVKLTGAATRPEVTFASRTNQWLFVNGRSVKDGTVSHAATLASRESLRGDRHPGWVLFLACDPELCDVNVHPQKEEVRFRDPGTIHSLVHRALGQALGGGKAATPLSGSSFQLRRAAPFAPPAGTGAGQESSWGGSPRAGAVSGVPGRFGEAPLSWLVSPPPVAAAAWSGEEAAESTPLGPLRFLGQYRESFLVAEGEDGLVLVDQHVAHERVRYERILQELGKKEAVSQQLLIPVTFDATPKEALAMERADLLLRAAGFLVSELSGRSFVVSASPSGTSAGAIVPFLKDLLERLAVLPEETGDESVPERAREALAASLACRGAITVNTKLRVEEATRLLSDLSRCADPFTCPHGRPIFLTLSHQELEKRFGRRG
jgi:DNA mismatch repair protein MutL